MADTVVIAEAEEEDTGYRFSWGIAFAGGLAAMIVTFVVLSLGAGFGLLLVNSSSHPATSPGFLTGGGLYFFAAQAFGFAVGGHIAGRLLGPLLETEPQEEFRAAAHGLVVWVVAILSTLVVVALAGATASTSGAATSALYGAAPAKTHMVGSASYLVDKLFRPASERGLSAGDVYVDAADRGEASRLIEGSVMRGDALPPDDHDRLVQLVAERAGLSRAAASERVDTFEGAVLGEVHSATTAMRKAASYASLWLAFSLIFGAIVAMASAVFARIEDDRQGFPFRRASSSV